MASTAVYNIHIITMARTYRYFVFSLQQFKDQLCKASTIRDRQTRNKDGEKKNYLVAINVFHMTFMKHLIAKSIEQLNQPT
jgi:hypothetical protein